MLPPQRFEPGRVPRDFGVGQLVGDFLRPRKRLAESGLHGTQPAAFSTPYLRRNRSTRPAVSSS
ncbi:MAG: hypothetical protein ACRD08_08045, partial [Acidimicrobiales bacterium]